VKGHEGPGAAAPGHDGGLATEPAREPSAGAGLDPDDWSEFRALAHRMVDDVIEGMRTVRDRPVWQSVPADVLARLREAVPETAIGLDAAYDEFLRDIIRYPRGNTHPRFWGWVNGSGAPAGVLADFLASAMNPSVGGFENAATLVEEQVLDWLKAMLGYERCWSAVLTSGCSMSNLVALAVARSARAPVDIRRLGVAAAPRPLLAYASTEAHSSVQKAIELLGLGTEALRLIPVDRSFRLDVAALERAIASDRRAGGQPIVVIGNAGTVNTGAIDDLDRLADVCTSEGLWLHVDGAFGALAWLCPELRPQLRGLQRADSLAFDLHKWMYLPYDVGCVFVRDADAHRRTFSTTPTYLSGMRAGPASYGSSFADLGIELTRRFRALKVWMALKAHGVAGFERSIRDNVRQAARLASRIEASADLELAAPVALNVVCFRFVGEGGTAEELDRLNREVLVRLQTSGVAMPSHSVIGGSFVIRVAITNHRSRDDDFDALVVDVCRLGRELQTAYSQQP